MKEFPKLYKKTSTGAIQEWTVSVDEINGISTIINRFGQVGGKIQYSHEQVLSGKNTGRSNETTPIEQGIFQAKARWDKQLKKGYVQSIEDAQAGTTDAIIEGGVFPILAHKFWEQGHKIKFPAIAQPKLDGHRCTSQYDIGKVTMWSRTRKQILTIPHIVNTLENCGLADRFDGELWHPDINIQENKSIEIPFLEFNINGNIVFLDEEDLPKLQGNKITISGNGYPITTYKHKIYYIHKLVLDLPESDVDHINRNKLDARKSNLRLVTESNNGANSEKRINNTSGYKGVMFFKRDENWHAQITHDYKKIHIGYFNTAEDAAKAYDKKAFELFGDHAVLNFPKEKITFEKLTSLITSDEPQDGYEVIQYHVYDLALPNLTNYDRYLILEGWRSIFENSPIHIVESRIVNSKEELMQAYEDFMEMGYEGAIVRNFDGMYVNKRSYDLQKVKVFDDDEFRVVDIKIGTKGIMAGKAVFICERTKEDQQLPAGITFDCKLKGKMDDLKLYADDKSLVIGRIVTVQYQGYTRKNKKPRFPVALRFKVDL